MAVLVKPKIYIKERGAKISLAPNSEKKRLYLIIKYSVWGGAMYNFSWLADFLPPLFPSSIPPPHASPFPPPPPLFLPIPPPFNISKNSV